jgi:hypothetical protein
MAGMGGWQWADDVDSKHLEFVAQLEWVEQAGAAGRHVLVLLT